MRVVLTEKAIEQYEKLESPLRDFFNRHILKLANMPPRRHMRFGMLFHVEDVTRQARLIYKVERDTLNVIRCFSTHKEYEAWFKMYR